VPVLVTPSQLEKAPPLVIKAAKPKGRSKADILDDLEHVDIELEDVEEELSKLRLQAETLKRKRSPVKPVVAPPNTTELTPSGEADKAAIKVIASRKFEEVIGVLERLPENVSSQSPYYVICERVLAENRMQAKLAQEEFGMQLRRDSRRTSLSNIPLISSSTSLSLSLSLLLSLFSPHFFSISITDCRFSRSCENVFIASLREFERFGIVSAKSYAEIFSRKGSHVHSK
tara:strand:- start:380 stop:1069 length:690 start_codon:yes stop_codon:yes gene_type:complete